MKLSIVKFSTILCTLSLTTVACAAKDTYDFTQVLKDLKGNPVMGMDSGKQKPLTLGDVVITSLTSGVDTDRGMTQDQKVNLFKLAVKVSNCKECALTSDDITLIKTRANIIYGPLIYGDVVQILDPASLK